MNRDFFWESPLVNENVVFEDVRSHKVVVLFPIEDFVACVFDDVGAYVVEGIEKERAFAPDRNLAGFGLVRKQETC